MKYNYQSCRIYNEDITLQDLKYFKEDDFFRTLTLPKDKPNIKKLYDILVIPEVSDIKLLKTNVEVSNEGKKLLGYKLVAQVILNLNLTYIVDTPKENICTTNFKVLKSMTIVLPNMVNSKRTNDVFKMKGINLLPYIEHCDIRQVDNRSFNISVLLLLDAKFCK